MGRSGLIPVIVQDYANAKVLMFTWMNREALQKSHGTQTPEAVYFSRSRRNYGSKARSGHVQLVKSLRMDCDQDVLLLTVERGRWYCLSHGAQQCF